MPRAPFEHELKILVEHWIRVYEGTKTFEIRDFTDRFFQKGDRVVLQAWCPKTKTYLHGLMKDEFPDIHKIIGDVYPIDSKRCVFSLLDEEEEEK